MLSYSQLCDELQNVRLNDGDKGGYTLVEIQHCVKVGHRETVVAARSYKATTPLDVAEGVDTIDLDPIFEPIAVSINNLALWIKTVHDFNVINPGWQSAANGAPVMCAQQSGSQIILSLTPDQVYSGTAFGYAAPPDMQAVAYSGVTASISTTEFTCPLAIPVGAVITFGGGTPQNLGKSATISGMAGVGPYTYTITPALPIEPSTGDGFSYPITVYPVGIADAFLESALLDRAEAEARHIRATYGNNSQLEAELMQKWQAFVQMQAAAAAGG